MEPEIKIEKNIPIPPSGRGRCRIYPYHKMEIGDSFYIPEKKRSAQQSISGSFALFIEKHKPDWKFTCRRWKDGLRVWRVK